MPNHRNVPASPVQLPIAISVPISLAPCKHLFTPLIYSSFHRLTICERPDAVIIEGSDSVLRENEGGQADNSRNTQKRTAVGL